LDFTLHYERFFDYHEAGRLIEKVEYLLFSSSTISETTIWEYDDHGELTLNIRSRKTNSNPYREVTKDNISLIYDDPNRLVQRRTVSYRFETQDPPVVERFNYYCGDILKKLGLDD
jgi:hypothetical protein